MRVDWVGVFHFSLCAWLAHDPGPEAHAPQRSELLPRQPFKRPPDPPQHSPPSKKRVVSGILQYLDGGEEYAASRPAPPQQAAQQGWTHKAPDMAGTTARPYTMRR